MDSAGSRTELPLRVYYTVGNLRTTRDVDLPNGWVQGGNHCLDLESTECSSLLGERTRPTRHGRIL
jgi:hypothetical protein